MSKFKYISAKSTSEKALQVISTGQPVFKVPVFKHGGAIKPTENIIPNGVLHEEKNEMGDKGMPVVSCGNSLTSCVKKYEIEKDEMIFTLEASKKVEKMIKNKDIEGLGNYVKSQILHNTHSFTEKFKDLNNYKDESIFS
jgi:hypothetical protein